MAAPATTTLFETVLDLSRYHREHERFYARAPLESALALRRAARAPAGLAERGATPSRRGRRSATRTPAATT